MKGNKIRLIQRMRSILPGICKGIGILFCIFVLAIIIQQLRTVKEEEYIPSMFGCTYLNVLSESMVPEFQTYDLVIGKKTDTIEGVRIGDVVTFRDGQTLVTHRVVGVNQNGGLVTRGDANDINDINAVTSDLMVSKHVVTIPKAGYIIAKLQDPIFLLVLWIVTMFVIIKALIKELILYRKQKDELQIAEKKTPL